MEDIGKLIVGGIASGALQDPEEVAALFLVANGGSPIRPTPSKEESATGLGTISYVKDAEGNTVVAGKVYLYRGERIRVQREVFGSGNMLDTYFRLYYLDGKFKEQWIFVEGKYPNGVFGGAVYKCSEITPAPEN